MTGVEILNKTEIIQYNSHVWWAGLIIFASLFLFGLIIGLKNNEVISSILVFGIGGLIAGLIITFILYFIPIGKVSTGTYKYQVIISDEVKMNEFNAKYKIIKQEGKIYTVVLKEDKENN